MFETIADTWRNDGAAKAAAAAKLAGLTVTDKELTALATAVKKANGTRKARLLEPQQVLDAIALSLSDPQGIGIVHGGEANQGEQRTTLCLAFHQDGMVAVGVGLSRARGAGPGVTWPALKPWSRQTPETNLPALRKWAKTKLNLKVSAAKATANQRSSSALAAASPAKARGKNVEQALLRDVLRDPKSDDARAVYADHLTEQGDPRGEFITVQLALAALEDAEGEPTKKKAAPQKKKTKTTTTTKAKAKAKADAVVPMSKREELEARSDALLKQHGAKWSHAVAQLTLKQTYRRGFIHYVEMRTPAFVLDGARLFDLAPIECVMLRGVEPSQMRSLAKAAALAKVEELALHGDVSKEATRALAMSPHLEHLKRLDIEECGIRAPELELLLKACANLEHLRIPVLSWAIAKVIDQNNTSKNKLLIVHSRMIQSRSGLALISSIE